MLEMKGADPLSDKEYFWFLIHRTANPWSQEQSM